MTKGPMDASESMAFVPWTWLSRGWLLGNQPNIQSCCSRRIPQDHYPLILSWNYQSHIHTLTPEQVYSVLVNLKHVPEGPPSKLPKLSPTKSKYVTPPRFEIDADIFDKTEGEVATTGAWASIGTCLGCLRRNHCLHALFTIFGVFYTL